MPLEVNFTSSANGRITSGMKPHQNRSINMSCRVISEGRLLALYGRLFQLNYSDCVLPIGGCWRTTAPTEPFPASDEDVRMFTLWYLWSRTHCLFIVVRSRPCLMLSLNILFVWRLFIIVTMLLNAGPRAGPVKYARRRLRADIGSLAALSPPRPLQPGSSPINKHQLITSWEERKPWPERWRPSKTELSVFSVFSLCRGWCGRVVEADFKWPLSHFILRGMFQVQSGWWIHQVGFLPSHFQYVTVPCVPRCDFDWTESLPSLHPVI